jgi:hypothetical protein
VLNIVHLKKNPKNSPFNLLHQERQHCHLHLTLPLSPSSVKHGDNNCRNFLLHLNHRRCHHNNHYNTTTADALTNINTTTTMHRPHNHQHHH